MRLAAVLYIVASVGANFFIGTLTTFALAALSFPLLVWLLLKKKPKALPQPKAEPQEVNSPGAF